VTVEYKLEQRDFIAFAEEQRRLLPMEVSRLYYYGLIPALCVALGISTQSFPIAVIFTGLFLGASWLTAQWSMKRNRRFLYSPENLSNVGLPIKATLSDEGITFTSAPRECIYRWPFIRKVTRGADYIYLVVTPLEKVHIPIRAFHDRAHLEQFVSMASTYVANRAS
jgi:hypothetical protein